MVARKYVVVSVLGILLVGLHPGRACATVEEPTTQAQVWIVNGTEEPVDVYLNHAAEPAVTDVKALSIGPEVTIKGRDDTPFGAYTFQARPKDRPSAPVLAAAAVDARAGTSFSAVLHRTPDGDHQMSVYRNDFTPSGDTRLTVRHTGHAEQVDWSIVPKDDPTDRVVDERAGSLGNGQWQQALDVVENDYRFEARVGGELAAVHDDLELEHEKDVVVYLVGDLGPYVDPESLRHHLLEQELQVRAAPHRPDRVTDPAPPLSTSDTNAPLQFGCPSVSVWQTNEATTEVSVRDPDGVVTDVSIAEVSPDADGVVIHDHAVDPATAIGESATATVNVLGDLPPGTFDVTLRANRDSLGHRAGCRLAVTVRAVTVPRLEHLVDVHQANGAVDDWFAAALHDRLDQVRQHLDAGSHERACEELKNVLDRVGDEKGDAVTTAAHDHLVRETAALRGNLGCG